MFLAPPSFRTLPFSLLFWGRCRWLNVAFLTALWLWLSPRTNDHWLIDCRSLNRVWLNEFKTWTLNSFFFFFFFCETPTVCFLSGVHVVTGSDGVLISTELKCSNSVLKLQCAEDIIIDQPLKAESGRGIDDFFSPVFFFYHEWSRYRSRRRTNHRLASWPCGVLWSLLVEYWSKCMMGHRRVGRTGWSQV